MLLLISFGQLGRAKGKVGHEVKRMDQKSERGDTGRKHKEA